MTTQNCGWSNVEETKLVEALVNMVKSGRFKADNGFKSGYLQHLEEKLKETFPNAGLLGKPTLNQSIIRKRLNGETNHFLTVMNCILFLGKIKLMGMEVSLLVTSKRRKT